MAVNGAQPFIKVIDSNGDPIVGAVLKVYEVGTTTYRNIYSDASLSVALTNPLDDANASNASGDFPRFYMAAGTYKLRAETSTGTLIWEYDNIDTGTSAGAGALPIASGGTGATTAAAARAALDVPSNSELTDLSDTIATFTASLQTLIGAPGGRLTPTSLTPVITTGVTAGTAVYYTPYTSVLCPVYDGAQFILETFAELTLTLSASHILSSHYDCFIINDSGTIRIVTGPAWSTITAGSGARGTGAGTTELTMLNGILVNANAMATARNGATTYSVAANRGTYVGSIFMDATNGQITCHTATGQSRKWSIWNTYNRRPIVLKVTDATASWTYQNATIRQSRATAGNTLAVFHGLPEEILLLDFMQRIDAGSTTLRAGASYQARNYIGVNSTTAGSGLAGNVTFSCLSNGVTAYGTAGAMTRAHHIQLPFIGVNNYNCLESTPLVTDASTFYGTEADMLFTAKWMA